VTDVRGLRKTLANIRRRLHPVVRPTGAFPQAESDLQRLLATDDPDVAAEILKEAEAATDEVVRRIKDAETRAAPLQTASAVGAAASVAAAGLLIDPDRIRGVGWQLAFAVAAVAIIVPLVACAYRATQSIARRHAVRILPKQQILERSGETLAEGRTRRAASLLKLVDHNEPVADYKLETMRGAAGWLVWALGGIVVLPILAGVYALFALN
jgi:hypothetical protein